VTDTKLTKYHSPGPERVGLIITNKEIVELANRSSIPDELFAVDPKDMINYENSAVATWHTHPKTTAALSGDDYRTFLAWPRLVHFIVGTNGTRAYVVENGTVLNAREDHPAWELVRYLA
jgi:proteasome lid subunit RPN8/RPN11